MLSPERIGTNGIREYKFDGTDMHVKTTFRDDKSLDINERIRRSRMLEKGTFGLHDNEDVRLVISCPSTMQWAVFRKKYPDVYSSIISTDEQVRMKGAYQLQLLHPDWVVMSRL